MINGRRGSHLSNRHAVDDIKWKQSVSQPVAVLTPLCPGYSRILVKAPISRNVKWLCQCAQYSRLELQQQKLWALRVLVFRLRYSSDVLLRYSYILCSIVRLWVPDRTVTQCIRLPYWQFGIIICPSVCLSVCLWQTYDVYCGSQSRCSGL